MGCGPGFPGHSRFWKQVGGQESAVGTIPGARCAILLLALICSTAACGSGTKAKTPAEQATFSNPVWSHDFPDPFVLRAGGTYHAYGTNGEGGNVQTLTSRDLVHWTRGRDALPHLGGWALIGKTWAPEVVRRADGKYVLYYTAASIDPTGQCIGSAVAAKPGGPFVDRSPGPLVCQTNEGGSIDPSPFVDGKRLYLVWKNDGNCCGKDTFLYAQRLSPDGLALTGKRVRLVHQDAAWEGNLVEAPTLWKQAGRYFLFFSANDYASSHYAVGYANCKTPLGPCRDAAENPILHTACRAAGPGHQAIVRDAGGDTWIVYHAWPPDGIGNLSPGRVVWIDRITFAGGKPKVHGPTCGAQTLP
jgi:beta-xylosidase